MILLVHAYILTGTVGYLTLVKPIELLFSPCVVYPSIRPIWS